MSGSAKPVSSVLTPFVFADEQASRGLGGAVELGLALAGLLELAETFHSAPPRLRLSHANPEPYDNDCGMGPEFAGNALALAMVFFAGR